MEEIGYKKKFLFKKMLKVIFSLFFLFIISFFIYYLNTIKAPENYPTGLIVQIEKGSNIDDISFKLYSEGIIKSPWVFKLTAYFLKEENNLKSGEYVFKQKENMFSIINRLSISKYDLDLVPVTIPEGWANYQIAERFGALLENFDEEKFLQKAEPKEGYLYPDTYLFLPNANEDIVIKEMNKNFKEKINTIQPFSSFSEEYLNEIIIMASLIEAEASVGSYETKQWISGVLHKRIEINMLLQVDAVFSYINQEHIPQVLFSHLGIDSPYNTYKYTGLPEGPIGNPGLDSIKAALFPIDTGNLFYITGNDGLFYYSKTFEGHNQNIKRYLR